MNEYTVYHSPYVTHPVCRVMYAVSNLYQITEFDTSLMTSQMTEFGASLKPAWQDF